uniref:PDZ domain-containing protein n=1 Tax=Chaetoceros debilis TaxID=122233 RepID=A0A7S3PUF8_9STRA|mmetsp:Transcript_30134/g.46103  ORF Transcript_30134/g.46103 Transcript_30134/m.46103 type:complete len:621 (+) Transcript_30134:133-1995(+)
MKKIPPNCHQPTTSMSCACSTKYTNTRARLLKDDTQSWRKYDGTRTRIRNKTSTFRYHHILFILMCVSVLINPTVFFASAVGDVDNTNGGDGDDGGTGSVSEDTEAPIVTTSSSPTAAPSINSSQAPTMQTNQPTVSPTTISQSFIEVGITMTLNGIETLDGQDEDALEWFEVQTKKYIETYYNVEPKPNIGRKTEERREDVTISGADRRIHDASRRRLKELQSLVNGVSVSIVAAHSNLSTANKERKKRRNLICTWIRSPRSNKRLLQSTSLKITYTQEMSYRIMPHDESEVSLTTQNLIQEPFNTFTRRNTYISFLQDPNVSRAVLDVFATLDSVGPPELKTDDDGEEGGISLWIIIVAAVGGGLVILLGAYCWWKRRDNKYSEEHSNPYTNGSDRKGSKRQTNGGVRLPEIGDEPSEMVDPPQAHGVYNADGSLKDFGHTPSIGTMDPDYVNAYAGASIVSSAGGTLGSRTMQSKLTAGSGMIMGDMSMGMGSTGYRGPMGNMHYPGAFDANDEQSFEQHLYSKNAQNNRREEIIEIYAPAGKLGVVIDTPDNGAPVVHNIKDTCPIADKLRVGDKLIAVDNEDVRSMTAVKVSKLISQKSGNLSRKFTVTRPIPMP